MSWKTEKTPKQTAEALKKKFTQEQINNGKITAAAWQEIIIETPKNIYYSATSIKQWLWLFFYADRNLDGNVGLQELLKVLDELKAKEDAKKEIKEAFSGIDVSGDKKLSLAEWFIIGFLKRDREDGYEDAKKID
ncbi:hypothetical protein N7499_008032 [Penicillium canescens]|uniref:EF-hand domain-containing protein n=1 Tax=Penicillium canescens TaxID=5083 RepID=A0AAD6HYA8_PENCN|nr:uncharacterized protein N7446_013068 [Penicillium canescens]KAJ6022717.1 hypothetical protein N7460_013112 [Penicillium canescens]KAJ6026021.1 hypothetical protein N7444_013700 [Penicillium canescens]KAJ6042002.1 hypothetical protein N7446_013068 [Penicillium canescens]KAJ6076051.1 hypothetical protein N7499_008032 [Penicillium canescens]KAJ6158362.1 hypothetical protein N7485_011188 [Penicillium canescens]